ncbi:hypothetical protein VaNZ11_002747 [Volvox africanus]|uniref:thiamine diphosphokinase n=1 Tax=Volvox africanus TaxID=51714 RepID=A0ABQ5RSK4_9CHLO|nr:hypothetical protein VaNZ11_002747 [Volvox africanus]
MRSLLGFSILRQRCSVTAVALKPEHHWTTSKRYTVSFVNPSPTHRRPGLAGIAKASGGLRHTRPRASSISPYSVTGLNMSVNHVPDVGTVGFGGGIPVPDSASNHRAAAAASFATQTKTPDPGKLGAPYDQFINSDFLGSEPLEAGQKVYLIVLNYILPVGLLHAWSRASVRICADGGCNRLYDELPFMISPPCVKAVALGDMAEDDTTLAQQWPGPGSGHTAAAHIVGGASADGAIAKQNAAGLGLQTEIIASSRKAYIPDVVIGDLDSVREDVRQFYEQHGVPFKDMSSDQDSNDLTKAIRLIQDEYIKDERDMNHQILVLGALGGRLDHTLANLNVLHVCSNLNITLWGDGNLVRLVRPGKARITPNRRFEGPTCGLIPIAGPVIATSSGLQWNVSATKLSVGGLVSSSNLLTESDVEVTCDGPLLWSTEVREEPGPNMDSLWAHTAAAARKREEQEGAVDTGNKPEAVAPMVRK